MRQIIEPTIEELAQDPMSKRRALLACFATYHIIDYLSGKRRRPVLRHEYCAQSSAFSVIDRISNTRLGAEAGSRRAGSGFLGNADHQESTVDGGSVLAALRQARDFLAEKVREHGSHDDQPAWKDTYYAVVPFDQNAQGDLEPGRAQEATNAVQAERLARSLAAERGGAIAFSRTGDHETGEFSDAVVLAKFGKVDLSAVR
jgi:hypothetical protein